MDLNALYYLSQPLKNFKSEQERRQTLAYLVKLASENNALCVEAIRIAEEEELEPLMAHALVNVISFCQDLDD